MHQLRHHQQQAPQRIPRAMRPFRMLQALDHAVADARRFQQVRHLVAGQQWQRTLDQPFAQPPGARLFHGQRQRPAFVQRGAAAGQRAQVFGQRPVHEGRGFAFVAQAVQHAQRARDLAVHAASDSLVTS